MKSLKVLLGMSLVLTASASFAELIDSSTISERLLAAQKKAKPVVVQPKPEPASVVQEPVCKQPAMPNGMIAVEVGQTQKCQILTYATYMKCADIRSYEQSTANGLLCENSKGKNALFLFDKNDVVERAYDLIAK